MPVSLLRMLVCLALGLAGLPLLLAHPAPLTDWPNHLARVHIATELLHGDAFWSRFYTLNPWPVPNAALDLGIGALHLAGMSVDGAASLFLLVSYAVFTGGFCRLARAFGSFDMSKPLLGSILFFTGPLMYGLVNYMLGLGLAFWLLAAWLEGSTRRRYALALFGTLALFYVHLLASLVWLVALACLEAPAMLTALRRAMTPKRALSTACAGTVFLALVAGSQAGADALPRGDGANLWYPGHGDPGATIGWKSSIVVRMVTDHVSPLVAGVTLLGLAAFALVVVMRGRPHLAAGAALAITALGLLVLALPEAAGTGSLLDYRLALAPFLIGAAALRVTWQGSWAQQAALACLLLVSLGRSAGLAQSFVREAALVHEFEDAVSALPPGSVLLTAFGHSRDEIPDQLWWSPPTEHLAARAAAHSVFVPTVFAIEAQQPLVLRPAYAAWRRTWQVRTQAEFDAMAQDVRPLCRSALQDGRRVFLFVAYPGVFLDSVIPPASLIASRPAFRLLDVCAVPALAS